MFSIGVSFGHGWLLLILYIKFNVIHNANAVKHSSKYTPEASNTHKCSEIRCSTTAMFIVANSAFRAIIN